MSEPKAWHVHKFGGTSLASAERYRNAAQIILERPETHKAVVVSAMAGVTDQLINLVQLASAQDDSCSQKLKVLHRQLIDTIQELLPESSAQELLKTISSDIQDIQDVLRALWLLKVPPPNALDLVSGFGELWSAQTLGAHLQEIAPGRTSWLNARDILYIEQQEHDAVVQWENSRNHLESWLRANSSIEVMVITGYIATNNERAPMTLGRNGSDYSASIFGSLLKAQSISIWTDVDGVLSADPRKVTEALLLDSLSYHEAMELAYFGAKVIHPKTMAPAVERDIPIYIKNTFKPSLPGTKIASQSTSSLPVKGITTIGELSLLNLEGTSMIGVPGIAHRLFGALKDAGISVVMISQGSSEHSICCAVPSAQAFAAQTAAEQAFFAERHNGQIQTIEVTEDCSVLAVVGDDMAGMVGLAGQLFQALGRAGVNVSAIAQGASERNISVVVKQEDATRALQAVHSGLYLSDQTISVGIIGPGVVGGALIQQLKERIPQLKANSHLDLRIRGIANSRTMLLDEKNIDLDSWQESLGQSASPVDLDSFAQHIAANSMPHAAIIDCTAQDSMANRYEGWIKEGIHVITPNKVAGSGDIERYQKITRASRQHKSHFLYETTVGAALPLLHTLHDLIHTGDKVLEVQGVLSGTLSYLLNHYSGQQAFSEILRDAKRKGFTEPDPRDDLSGMDVARKLVILAREMGLSVGLDQVKIKGLVPEELKELSTNEFMESLAPLDLAMQKALEEAKEKDQVLRFVGTLNQDAQLSVGLRSFPKDHAFAQLKHTDNIVQFKTRRYFENPLIVQGPGAGPEVTAGGIFSDLLRLANYLGAKI